MLVALARARRQKSVTHEDFNQHVDVCDHHIHGNIIIKDIGIHPVVGQAYRSNRHEVFTLNTSSFRLLWDRGSVCSLQQAHRLVVDSPSTTRLRRRDGPKGQGGRIQGGRYCPHFANHHGP